MSETMNENVEVHAEAREADTGLGPKRALEAVAALLGFAAFLYLVMRPESGWTGAVLSGAVILAGLAFLRVRRETLSVDSRRLWTALFALSAGFHVFNALRRAGIADWPIQHVHTTGSYATLLYMHVVLLMTMAAAAAWAVYGAPPAQHLLRWGSWRKDRVGRFGQVALLLMAVGAWTWAVITIRNAPHLVGGSLAVFLGLALAKSFIGALIEEGCYRGVVLPMATARFGLAIAIVLQACMYGVFHAYLTPGSFDRVTFVAITFGLGILFGIVSHVTKGIGWACVAHASLSMVIEWHNLS